MWWVAKRNKLAFASQLFRKTGEWRDCQLWPWLWSTIFHASYNKLYYLFTEFQTKLQTINHTTRLLRYINSIMTPEKRAFINEKYKGLFKSLWCLYSHDHGQNCLDLFTAPSNRSEFGAKVVNINVSKKVTFTPSSLEVNNLHDRGSTWGQKWFPLDHCIKYIIYCITVYFKQYDL